MNSKWHLYLSFLKSFLRIFGCILCLLTGKVKILAIWFLVAEVIGILEEVGDNR